MKVDQIRQSYLDFFAKKAHPIIASDSLVPQNDPSLLFTGAGMNQFKENFLGVNKELKRATTSQKCLRTGDLEEVGRTPFHHSFFEMLGNFSFGDYFKEEAITWAWEYLTQVLKIPAARLRVTVHQRDEEAYKIWIEKIKIRPDWVYKLGDKGNFWPSNAPTDGPNGPCGPCSEIYFDQNPEMKDEDINGSRFAEIWNLVFTQYDRQDGGKLVPLAQKNIDTGMGLERLACVLQGKETNFEIDSFQPINEMIEKKLGVKVPKEKRRGLYAVSDHLRAVTFALCDGVIPSNEGRGYVIRKLIRRALWHARQLTPSQHLNAAFLWEVVPTVGEVMSKPYPEIKESAASIQSTLKGEEERFLMTLDTGIRILEDRLKKITAAKLKTVPGEVVFELYDTYGFPEELTRNIAEKEGFEIDHKGFEQQMDAQRKRAKDATQISATIFSSTDLEKKIAGLEPTKFLGYDNLSGKGKILLAEIEGKKGVIVLDQTPCYGESGGQVGDMGIMEGAAFKAKITDTQKKDKWFIHAVEIEKGSVKEGDNVQVTVDQNRRERTMRNHTATHLLHAALREILGPQVRQLGSLVSPDKLRFDYSYGQALTPEQTRQIEDKVNSEILKNTALTKEEKAIEDAKKDGAIAFFGEKYGAKVRVVTVPGFSKEFCGGTHCDRTGQIGFFVITSESSIASGTRRIEALTGEGGFDYIRSLRSQVSQLASALKTTPDQLGERVAKLQDSLKKMEKEQSKAGASQSALTNEKSVTAGAYTFKAFCYKDITVDALRKQSDDIRSKSTNTVYFIGTESGEKLTFLVASSGDLAKKIDVRELAKEIAQILGGSGGGRPDMVQGGAPNNGQLSTSIDKITAAAKDFLSTKV